MPPDRFRVATALPPDGGWRCELALDREATPPRPVALARVPPAVSGDASALAALARGVDLASRLTHPSLPQVLGLVELGGGLAVVSAFREGESLRAVLDGGGALGPALASRVVGDVARAVQAIHGLAAAGPKALAHGAIRPENVLVCEDGAVLLTGLGRPVEPPPIPSDDLAALPRLLAECLAPGGVGAVPPELAALATDVLRGDQPRTAAEFADALAAAAPPAPPGALVARVDSAIPKGASARASRRRALTQALLAEAGGEAGPLLSPPPGAMAAPAPPPASPATPALSPPPLRPALTPAPGSLAALQPPRIPPAATTGSSAEAVPASTSPGGAEGGVPTPGRSAEGAVARSTPSGTSASSPLDDPRFQTRVALALALAGLVIGFLLGRR